MTIENDGISVFSDPSEIPVAFYDRVTDNIPRLNKLTWKEIVELLTTPCQVGPCTLDDGPKKCKGHGKKGCKYKDHMLWSPVLFRDGDDVSRKGVNVKEVTVFVLDYDGVTAEDISAADEKVKPYRHIWHSTHSHRKDYISLRLVIALAEPIPGNQWETYWKDACNFFGVRDDVDPKCKDPSRMFYLPSHPIGIEPVFEYGDGLLLPRKLNVLSVTSEKQSGLINNLIATQPKPTLPSSFISDDDVPEPVIESTKQLNDLLADYRFSNAHKSDSTAKERAELIGRVLDQKPLAEPGSRGSTTARIAAICARIFPPKTSEEWFVEVIRPAILKTSIDRTPGSDSDVTHNDLIVEAVRQYVRLMDIRLKSDKEEKELRKRRNAWAQAAARKYPVVLGYEESSFDKNILAKTPPPDSSESNGDVLVANPDAIGSDVDAASADVIEASDEASSVETSFASTKNPVIVSDEPVIPLPIQRKDKQGNDCYVKCGHNIYIMLRTLLPRVFRWNDLRKTVEINKNAKLDYEIIKDEYKDILRRLTTAHTDVIPMIVANFLTYHTEMMLSKEDIIDQMLTVAHENSFNPLVDHLRSKQWDGVNRVDNALIHYFGVKTTNREGKDITSHIQRISRRWFISAVARALQPGCKVDTVLVLEGMQGSMKCLGRGTPVLMYDGSIKPVENIVNGDLVMGPDSLPRRVNDVVKGYGKLKKIVPVKGDSWVCNDNHILTVATRDNKGNRFKRLVDISVSECYTKTGNIRGDKPQSYIRGRKENFSASAKYRGATKTAIFKGEDIDIIHKMRADGLSYQKISNLLGKGSYTAVRNADRRGHLPEQSPPRFEQRAERIALVRTGVDFPAQEVFDPYFTGLWLGDGTVGKALITNEDCEIIDYCKNMKLPDNLFIRIEANQKSERAVNINFTTGDRKGQKRKGRNTFLNFVRTLYVNGEKRIPRSYLINDRSNRLKLLAGLIDTDGGYDKGCYSITTEYTGLRDDLLFLARSLGFAAYAKPFIAKEYPDNIYWTVLMSGNFVDVPCLLPRKKPKARKQVKNVLQTGFGIEDVGEGEFFGFELDGDGRFLLGDFTITHNSSTLKALAGEFFCDTQLTLGDKDSRMLAAVNWIIELAELDSINRTNVSAFKAFLSSPQDDYRPPYGRVNLKADRCCVFVGTTNDDAYLKDRSGNRRFWGVRTGKILRKEVEQDADQLWAEAVAAFDGNGDCPDCLEARMSALVNGSRCAQHRWWLEEEEEVVAREQISERVVDDAWEPLIIEWWKRKRTPDTRNKKYTGAEIAKEALDIPVERMNGAMNQLGVVLKHIGFNHVRERIENGKLRWCYEASDELKKSWLNETDKKPDSNVPKTT